MKSKPLILVVDNSVPKEKVQDFIEAGYDLAFTGGDEVVEQATKRMTDLIIVQINVSDMKWHDICTRLKAHNVTKSIPIFHVKEIDMDGDVGLILARVKDHLASQGKGTAFTRVFLSLIAIAKMKDNNDSNHVPRMAMICYFMAFEMGHGIKRAYEIFLASLVHDIGKADVSDEILSFSGDLRGASDLWEIMKAHTTRGAAIIGSDHVDSVLSVAHDIVLHHHEQWNGRGYPDGLMGADISDAAQIAGLADMVDVMLGKDKRSGVPILEDSVLSALRKYRGIKLSEDVVDAAIRIWPDIMWVETAFADGMDFPLADFVSLDENSFFAMIQHLRSGL